jgi:hypothetical protein
MRKATSDSRADNTIASQPNPNPSLAAPMPVDHIRYDLLTQQALRSVVRTVLSDAAKHGLPGEHHFYISFDTHAPGVKISPRLRTQYPEDMTIVLQHQFWDLTVTEQGFEVGLSFNGVPERLVVPFEAVKGFFDPSVQFGLQFETASEQPAADEAEAAEAEEKKPVRSAKKPAAEPAEKMPEPSLPTPAPADAAPDPDKPSGGAEVVRLDRFRKK